MIKIFIIGRIGKDATMNQVNGRSVINFSVAHSERYKDNMGNDQERTIWAECAYWTDRTAVLPYLLKGTQVYVEGTPDVRTYQKNDGTWGSSLTVRVRDIQLLGSRAENVSAPAPPQQPTSSPGSKAKEKPSAEEFNPNDGEDDLPF